MGGDMCSNKGNTRGQHNNAWEQHGEASSRRDIREKMESRQKACVKQIFESKINCMKDYMKLFMREYNPDHLTFYFGTNKIPSNYR